MLDIAFIRNNPELVQAAVRNKGERADVDAIVRLDVERRQAVADFEKLRGEQNRVSKEIAAHKKNKEDAKHLDKPSWNKQRKVMVKEQYTFDNNMSF